MSEGAAGGGEKTYDPTPKRLEEARKRGDIPKSDEITGAGVYLGFLLAAVGGGGALLQGTAGALSAFLGQSDLLVGRILGAGGGEVLSGLLSEIGWGLLPFFALPAAGALIALFGQRAIVFAGSKLEPKLNRISPIAQIKNKFGPTGLVEFLKRVVKLTAVSITVYLILSVELDRIIGTTTATAGVATTLLLEMTITLLIGVTLLACAVASIDYAWVQFDHQRQQKMSLQELRDEAKEVEGDPALKAKRRRRATEIANNKMLAEVPTADVVVVNPTHIAIALKWSREPGTAPVCVAKGRDNMAAKIRELAEEAAIPVHRDVPTARALYDLVEIGHEVPPDHYRPVAAAIRFAEDMRRRMRERDGPRA